MAPSKRPEMLVEALRMLDREGLSFTATFVGSPAPEHETYYQALVESAKDLSPRVTFLPAVTKHEASDLYRAHDLFVNCTPSGSYDKTLFEAAACGAVVLAASSDYAALAGDEFMFSTATELAQRLEQLLTMPDLSAYRERLAVHAQEHALSATVRMLAQEME
jgi:glycosyltransferase involved in cell wall biosynthesis